MPTTQPISTITFTPVPSMAALVEPGHCDPNQNCGIQCGTCQWSVSGTPVGSTYDCCRVAGCSSSLVPKTVPIKQLINGSSIAPWVRLRFESGTDPAADAASEITTGNISQPGTLPNGEICRAVIKSFQYGWGALVSGNSCKVTIVDESGSSFTNWVNRIIKNPETGSFNNNLGVYKMKVTWGWLITGGDGACPSQAGPGTGTCIAPGSVTSGAGCTAPMLTNTNYYSSDPNTILCSPPCWFLPNTITVNMQQNGKFVYEIEGVDLLVRSNEHSSARIYGTDLGRMYFTDAAQTLANESTPRFNICFQQLNEDTDQPEPLQFWVEPNVGIANPSGTAAPPATLTTPDPNVRTKGPKQVWRCQEYNPLATLLQWITSGAVKADTKTPGVRGKGITFNYDSTFTTATPVGTAPIHGKVMLWADALPTGNLSDVNVQKRLKALYVVNGGKCSPVFSFTPQMKWNFTAAVRAGGAMGTTLGTMYKASVQLERNALPGRGYRTTHSPPQERALIPNGTQTEIEAMAAHRRANVLHHSIEAELRIQGDPSDWLCTPVKGYGRCVALVVINPFSLDQQQGADCPTWSNVNTGGNCNTILTNRAWFIKGADHQIKEGSYITTLKIVLFAPGGDSQAAVTVEDFVPNPATVPVPLGVVDPQGYIFCSSDGGLTPGTFACNWKYPLGDDPAIILGTGETCDAACT